MAQSNCPKCNGTHFEGVEKSISGLKYSVTLVQCAECGCVIGVLNTSIMTKHINDMARQLLQVIINHRR